MLDKLTEHLPRPRRRAGKITIFRFSAMLVTGGGFLARQSAEIYHLDRDFACVLPDLPDFRYGHTQDGSLLCGGYDTPRSCLKWNSDNGRWDMVTETLTENRWGQTSWTPVDGSVTHLMGGSYKPKTSEAIDKDHKVIASFPLPHEIK